jgi:2-methylisocitrate lyase-like PEP mutase family enzyme
VSASRTRARFRELLQRKNQTLLAPGGFSPLLARMVEQVGFGAFFLAGSQTAAFLYALPDVGIVGLRDMVDHARHVAARTSIPILADADTGFGNAVGVHYTVQEYIRAGVAGLNIEDQEAPKKSGTGGGRRCISVDEALGKYRAAAAARDELDPEFVICARTDSMGAEGGGLEDAIQRGIAYATDGRADLIWVNTLQTLEQMEEACRRIPAPVLPAYLGAGPEPTLEQLNAMGAAMYLYPGMTTGVALQATWELLNDFKERGTAATADSARRTRASKWGPVDRDRLLENQKVRDLERDFLPGTLQRDYEHTFGWGTRAPS